MHDVSIKLLAVGRDLGRWRMEDDDDDVCSHYCRAKDRIWCMMEQNFRREQIS